MILEPKIKRSRIIVDKAPAMERHTVIFEETPFSITPNGDGVTHQIVCEEGDKLVIYPKVRMIMQPDEKENFIYVEKKDEAKFVRYEKK